jgi:RNA polymerase sigma-70 factor (ECF subfamily)
VDARALIDTLGAERPRFVRMARSRVESQSDAEDVVQRAMLRAAERAGSLEDPARARAWFYRILRHAIVDHHRSQPREEAGDVDELPVDDVDASPVSACCCAVKLLSDLRPAYAEALRRMDFDGDDAATVAAALAVSPANLYVRLHRARHALRERVERHCGVSSLAPCLDCGCHAHGRCGD